MTKPHARMILSALIMSWLFLLSCFLSPCLSEQDTLVIFHAGSLSKPLSAVEHAFEKRYPHIDIRRQASGSVLAIRKVTDLGKDADIIISADYTLIPSMLFPNHAKKAYVFAGNEMCLCYKTQRNIPSEWGQAVISPDVRIGLSDPNLDPCGYRALMTVVLWAIQTATIDDVTHFFQKELGVQILGSGCGIELRIPRAFWPLSKRVMVRPKSVELLSLLDAGMVDYIFEYKSVALSHGLSIIPIPPSQNLGMMSFKDQYSCVAVRLGLAPAKLITGTPIAYGLCVLKKAPNPKAATLFRKFLFSRAGMGILKRHHLRTIDPPVVLKP